LRMRLVEPFDDRERLRQQSPIVHGKHRHQTLRIEAEILRRILFSFAQMNESALRNDSFEIERDANAISRRGAEIIVELHAIVQENAEMPVCARPSINAWISCVPS